MDVTNETWKLVP